MTTTSDTGTTLLPDVGSLTYNGIIFSPLVETRITMNTVKDSANRNVKYVEYTLVVDGYVTVRDGFPDIMGAMVILRNRLSVPGASLSYIGRGYDLNINPTKVMVGIGAADSAISRTDVAWGPMPEVLDFQPLGGGLSAKISWQVKFRITEIAYFRLGTIYPGVLQFTYETTLTYGDDGYSKLSARGSLEIPLTYTALDSSRRLPRTADNFRSMVETNVMKGIDLNRFHIIHREFHVSRDKRTLDWNIDAEEKSYMDLPPYCSDASGSFSVRPAKSGAGLVNWHCSLRATYKVRADHTRRIAWFAFLSLLGLRMKQSSLEEASLTSTVGILPISADSATLADSTKLWRHILRSTLPVEAARVRAKSWLIDFSVDEGLYKDSKTMSFSATWKLVTPIGAILRRSGLWKKPPERTTLGGNLWAISMQDVSGYKSWLTNTLNPSLDVVVDFGAP